MIKKNTWQLLIEKLFKLSRWNILLILLVILAATLTLMPFVLDGRYLCIQNRCGMSIGTNYRDGAWFLAVAKTSFLTIPFQMPNFSGMALEGYHYLPNYFAFLLSYLGIPITTTYYQIVPVLYVSGMMTVVIWLGKKITNNKRFGILFFFTFFFGMHLSLLTSVYHKGVIDNGALINTFQATRILESPHTALAMIALFSVIGLLHRSKTICIGSFILILVAIFVTMGTKFYVAAALIGVYIFYEALLFTKSRKLTHVTRIMMTCIVVVIAFRLFYGSSGSQSVFIYSPFATVHHLIESDGLFYQPRLVLARYYLYEQGWSPRLLAIELYSTMLFILYYFGVRSIGLMYLIVQGLRKKLELIDYAIGLVITVCITCSVLFIQRGDWYNPIQFAVPAAFLSSIYTAQFLYRLLRKHPLWGWLTICIVITITLPAHFVNAFYPTNPARYLISKEEMHALTHLEQQPYGAVFFPIDENDMMYVSAFTGKPGYVNYLNVLENIDVNHTERLAQTKNPQHFYPDRLNIRYVYLPKRLTTTHLYQEQMKQSKKYKVTYENKGAIVYTKL